MLPLDPYPGVNKPWRSRCLVLGCGRETSPTLYWARKATRSPCRWCAGIVIAPEDAKAAMQRAGWFPLEPYPGVDKPWRSQHQACGQISTPRLDSIKNSGRRMCGYCAGSLPITEDVAVTILLAAPPYGAVPLESFTKARKPWRARCLGCDEEIAPRLDNIKSGQGICGNCSGGGFNTAAPALVYLVCHDEANLGKVGICNVGGGRLQTHRRSGWGIHDVMHLPGLHARQVEQAVLRAWRSNRMWPRVAAAKAVLPYGGWTEAVSLEHASREDLWSHIETARARLDAQLQSVAAMVTAAD
ncbi:hypothetical protein [Kitasatospora sp. NPDC051164]|uniref:hypothetical protein n=1 Tax=Kitasatospora sp. NPDC051164 TaxID=3364055 RepID=UPI0037B34746